MDSSLDAKTQPLGISSESRRSLIAEGSMACGAYPLFLKSLQSIRSDHLRLAASES
jgi:hypothetical protein